MNKFLAGLALSLVALTASATDWFYIMDTVDGRFLSDKHSLKIEKNVHGVLIVSADFTFFKDGIYGPPVFVVLGADSCANGGGEMVYVEGSGSPVSVFWSSAGHKVYDAAGIVLCAGYFQRLKEEQK